MDGSDTPHGCKPYLYLEEGDYFLFNDHDPTLPRSQWLFDRGYLLSVDRQPALRIWYNGRRFHYQTVPNGKTGYFKPDDFLMTAQNVVREVETKIAYGRKDRDKRGRPKSVR